MAGDCTTRQHRAFAVAGGSFRRTIFHDLSLEWSAFGAHEFHPWGERAPHKQVFVCGVNKRSEGSAFSFRSPIFHNLSLEWSAY